MQLIYLSAHNGNKNSNIDICNLISSINQCIHVSIVKEGDLKAKSTWILMVINSLTVSECAYILVCILTMMKKIGMSKKHSSRMSTICFIILHPLCPDQGVYGQGVVGIDMCLYRGMCGQISDRCRNITLQQLCGGLYKWNMAKRLNMYI